MFDTPFDSVRVVDEATAIMLVNVSPRTELVIVPDYAAALDHR